MEREGELITPPTSNHMIDAKVREYIIALALKFQGTPYIWGGSVPYIGFDCSGFVVWILQVFGILPSGDWTADGLGRVFPHTESPEKGDLCLYGTKDRLTHVMFYVDDDMCVGASGGGSETTSVEIARARGAQVKVKKPVKYRSDFRFYCKIEMRNGNSEPEP